MFLGYLNNWGGGESMAFTIAIFLGAILLLIAIFAWDVWFLVFAILCAYVVMISATMEDGREERLQSKEVARVLSQYDWEVSASGPSPHVEIGACRVELRLVKLNGNDSLFAIGREAQAQPADVIYDRVVKLCEV